MQSTKNQNPIHKNLLKRKETLTKNSANLTNKIHQFIRWYSNNIIKLTYTKNEILDKSKELRNFIEKMAVWYELRYPEYEVNRKIHSSSQEARVSDIMFNQNKYINEQLNQDSEIRILDWDEFYNASTFINSLPFEEKQFLSKPRYPSQIEIIINGLKYLYRLTDNGYLRTDNNSIKISVNDKSGQHFDFKDIHIESFIAFLKKGDFELSQSNIKSIETKIQTYKNECYAKEELLNCVMYRIIERDGIRTGPRRAFLFAKEFDRNIDIPMIYGIDSSDPELRLFINEYLKAGGKKELVCYTNYFARTSRYERLSTMSIEELLSLNNTADFYTPEEDLLHQRLVDALSNRRNEMEPSDNQPKIKTEEIHQLRLQRKLDKSKPCEQ